MFKKDEIVTIKLGENNNASNTYKVFGHIMDDAGDMTDAVILYHPLQQNCMIVKHSSELNKVQANVKDSDERALEFATKGQGDLDHNLRGDLEALRLYYVINRALTNHQKNQLASICGTLASIYFRGDITLAIRTVNDNKALLNPFNEMWFTNFKDLFSGKKPIVSPKQRTSIFNIAGFILAELQRNETRK